MLQTSGCCAHSYARCTVGNSCKRMWLSSSLWSVVCGLSLFCFSALAGAQDLTFSAKADKTNVNLGDPITLTITFAGDIQGVQVPNFEFPGGFSAAARSQSSSFSIRGGVMERSVSIIYVLIPQRSGTFTLGPFVISQGKKTFKTEPIEIKIQASSLPSKEAPKSGRYLL